MKWNEKEIIFEKIPDHKKQKVVWIGMHTFLNLSLIKTAPATSSWMGVLVYSNV